MRSSCSSQINALLSLLVIHSANHQTSIRNKVDDIRNLMMTVESVVTSKTIWCTISGNVRFLPAGCGDNQTLLFYAREADDLCSKG